MDRSLDEIIAERPQSSNRDRRGPRRGNRPRDNVKKSFREEPADLDQDWVHDRFEDDKDTRRPSRGPRNTRHDLYTPQSEQSTSGAKVRVSNLHYDLTEDDLTDLFTRIGPILSLSLIYDRAGRSDGLAFVTYKRLADAQAAIREFDGANAKGQPIRLTLVPSDKPRSRNPFDTAERPKGSLFDRTERPRGRDSRSLSPEGERESTEHTRGRDRSGRLSNNRSDRYIPPGARSPRRRNDGGRNGARGGGRQGGEARERNDSGRGANGRPKKTVEDLDQEMRDYWGAPPSASEPAATNGENEVVGETAPAAPNVDDDIDMIE